MRRRCITMSAAVAAAAVCSGLFIDAGAVAGTRAATGARAAVSGGTWGSAEEVPGSAALNPGGTARIASVSCGTAGNCSAGGYYTDGSGHDQAFIASETKGTWHSATEVPGTAALNTGGFAEITSVSCASAGNCSAGGDYTGSAGRQEAFVADEVNGTWHRAREVPGIGALNQGWRAVTTSVSCRPAGNCSAGGYYIDGSGNFQAFVADEVNGTWRTALQVPGTAALNTAGAAALASVSCASAGNCSAGGYYYDTSSRGQVFVASEVNGVWGTAVEVAGTAVLNQGGNARITAVSCGAAGNCSAGGSYADGSGHGQAFVASEAHGTWGPAREVPGTAALNQAGSAQITSVSCGAAGNCSAGGSYADGSRHGQAFVVSQAHGTWGPAREVPGTAALNQGGSAQITSVSCPSAGNCSAGGSYDDASLRAHAFVAGETNGTWGTAMEVPGTAALNQQGAEIASVSCASAGHCSAGGDYQDGAGHTQVFVVSES